MLAWLFVRHNAAWFAADASSFSYWTVLKVFVWTAPALWLIRRLGRTLVSVFGGDRLGAKLAWGLGVGLAAINAAAKQSFAPTFSYALLSAAVVAPIAE